MAADELELWLLSLPLNEPCPIDDESVYLRLGDDGAELGLVLAPHPTGAQVVEAMRSGFQGALAFQAGLALSADGELVLSRWMPGAQAWTDVAEGLEELLYQAAMWREAGVSDGRRHAPAWAEDARVRRALGGG